jgi:hypothetical protein
MMALGGGAAGGVSCVDVLLVFVRRSVTLGRACGAVADEMYDAAVAQAAVLDALPRGFGLLGGGSDTLSVSRSPWLDERQFPLLGVPVCVSERVDVEGCDSFGGRAASACCAPEDSACVLLLRAAGAIPFVRVADSKRLAWGPSPWGKPTQSAGSGEACFFALRCSPLGLGTGDDEQGGVSAAVSGLVKFTPTPARVSRRGVGGGPHAGQLLAPNAVGPAGKTVRRALAF